MDLQTSKIELAKRILNIENSNLISKIKDLDSKKSSDFYSTLTNSEKKRSTLGLNKPLRTSVKDYLNKVSS